MTGSLCKIISRWYISIVLVLPIHLAAQSGTASLQRLVNAAMQHSPALRSKEALVNSSEQDIKSIKDTYLPTAVVGDELEVSSANSLPGSYLSMGIIPSTSGSIHDHNTEQAASGNFALFMSQYEIASFGYKDARIKNAEAITSLRNSDVNRDAYLLKWRLSKLYFTLLQQQLQLSIEAQNVKRYESLFDIIRGIAISGLKAGADSSQALAELSKTKINYNDALKQTDLLKQELSYLSGIGTDSIAVDTTNTGQQQLITQLMQSNNDSVNSPLLDFYKTQQDVYKSNEALVAKSFRPHLLLTGTAWARGSSIGSDGDYKSMSNGLGYQRYNYLAGVSLFYNLFSGIQKRDRLAASRYDTDAGDFAMQQEKESLDNISKGADESISIAAKNLAELPVQLQAASDAFNQKTAQYKAGIINLVDLTNATYVLYRAQSDYARALNDWFLANVDKAAVTGNLDLFIQSLK